MIDREAWCAAVHRVVTDDVIWLRVTKQVALKVDPRTSAQPSAGLGKLAQGWAFTEALATLRRLSVRLSQIEFSFPLTVWLIALLSPLVI